MQTGELFDDENIATGYARDRPPVHRHLMGRVVAAPEWAGPVGRALDVGCGAGASTAALAELATFRIGVDPSSRMVQCARRSVSDIPFVVGTAEALPVAAGSIDLVAAAGSLNFAELGVFGAEADRVLAPGGWVVVSDYSFGVPADASVASNWPAWFAARWPKPFTAPVTASSFRATPFRVVASEEFVVTLSMDRDAYLAYVMTELNVARAIAHGASARSIRDWCVAELAHWTAPQTVSFPASVLVLRRSID